MRYLSTRDAAGVPPRPFCDILLEGLAPDGGLYLPQRYPRVDAATLAQWRAVLAGEGYPALAHRILRLYVDDIPDADLQGICERAYTAEKFTAATAADIVPVTRLALPESEAPAGVWLGHLSDGPTAAFKDMAMQLLGELFAYELGRRGETLNILGATSGDTGSSAEYAMLGKPGVMVFMLTPAGRMTPFQQAQMFSLDNPSIVNIAVDGVFDDCQDLVKTVSADADFKRTWRNGAVNSINWARLLAQVVYYVACWLRVTDDLPGDDAERDAQRVSFSVPTGNFGDICAGHVARSMGVPIDVLLCATNENDVLDEFFRTGVYRVRASAETTATSSPSMDISKASNFERFVFDLLDRDAARVADLFGRALREDGAFDLSGDPAFARAGAELGFTSGRSTHADRVAAITRLEAATGVVIDPHTADALTSGLRAIADGRVTTPLVVLETALPVKFAGTIREALGRDPERPERFEGIEDLPRHVIDVGNDAGKVKALIEERGLRPHGAGRTS